MAWFENRGFGSSQYPYAKKKPIQNVVDVQAGEQGPLGPRSDYVVGPSAVMAATTDPYNERRALAQKAITPVQATVSTQDDAPMAAVKGAALGGAMSAPMAGANDLEVQKARYRHLNEQFNLGTAANIRSRHLGKGEVATDLESIRAERDAIGRMLGSRANAAELDARSQITDEQRALKYREMQGIMTSNLDREKKLGYEMAGDAQKRSASNFMATTPNEYSVAPDMTNYAGRIAGQGERAKFWGDESMKIKGERDTAVADRKRATDLAKQTGFAAMENQLAQTQADGRAINNPVKNIEEQYKEYAATKMFNDTKKADELGKLGIRTPEDFARVSSDIMTSIDQVASMSPFGGQDDAMAVLTNEHLPLYEELSKLDPDFARQLARQVRSKLAMSKNGFWNGVGKLADTVTPDFIRENTPSWVNYATSLGLPIPTPGGVIETAKLYHAKMKNVDMILKKFENK